eukprot:scaffold592988_cov17-Prasinocladus_malaysianus.AAC.1
MLIYSRRKLSLEAIGIVPHGETLAATSCGSMDAHSYEGKTHNFDAGFRVDQMRAAAATRRHIYGSRYGT